MQSFNELNIDINLKNSISRANFKIPTPVQSQSIPIGLNGKDILGTAQTGTGKTLAFCIPLINKLIIDKNAFALVMCPTRELAAQVMNSIKNLIDSKINIKTALLIGGESMQKQLRQLGKRSRIIVGTPGRINDHLKRKSLNLSATKYLVLDETDRMLDMGFTPQIEMVLKFIPKNHQTLLFSATLPQNIIRISEKYLKNPSRISVGPTTIPVDKIKQETLDVYKENKYDELIDQLLSRKGSILVFVKTKRSADKMVKRLKEEDHSADAIHGDLRQSKRDRVINSFRKGVKRILIATDVAARGLDIPLIQHVINYDLPQVPEDYIHRIGRTARAGSEGSALTFLTRDDRLMWNSISKLINPNFKATPRDIRKNSRRGKNKKDKAPYNKKRNFRDEKKYSFKFKDKKKFFNKNREDSRSVKDGERKSFSFKDKKKFFNKNREDSRSVKDGERKSFSFKDKKKFFNKNREDSRSVKDGERKSFSFKDKKKFFNKNREDSRSVKDGERKSFSFKDKKKFFNKNREDSRSVKDGERKSFNFKDKKKFFNKNDSTLEGYTNNPKFFNKQKENSELNDNKRKKFDFKKGKKRFKNRSRPKSFKFKKHNRSRN